MSEEGKVCAAAREAGMVVHEHPQHGRHIVGTREQVNVIPKASDSGSRFYSPFFGIPVFIDECGIGGCRVNSETEEPQ